MLYIQYYNNYKDKIFSYFFYNLSQDRSLAEDLTSDTFMKGFEKFESYNENFQFSTWIFTIARNTLYDYYRKSKIEVSIEDHLELSQKEFLKYELDFTGGIETEVQMQEVYKAFEKIPNKQKEMLIMKYLDDFTTKEISHMTGSSEANIRKILSRGLQRLAQILPSLSD